MPANKPRNFPQLRRGEGSWHWNAERRQVELKHTVDGHRYTERADTPALCLDLRDERRAKVALLADVGTPTVAEAVASLSRSLSMLLARHHEAEARLEQRFNELVEMNHALQQSVAAANSKLARVLGG